MTLGNMREHGCGVVEVKRGKRAEGVICEPSV
jgi:hypothetical protein